MTVGAAEPDWRDWLRRPPPHAAPVLTIDGFEGPLDWLLDLARGERIDLRQPSILDSWTRSWRRSRQGWPRGTARPAAPAAAAAAGGGRSVLGTAQGADVAPKAARGAAIRHAAAWLDGRVQLGRDVFVRGLTEDRRWPKGGDIVELLWACLVAPRADAAARITRLLNEGVAGEIALFLPQVPSDTPERNLRCRAALAGKLVAGLEFAEGGGMTLDQEHSWCDVMCRQS